MPKFDISNEELSNLIKEKSTSTSSLVNNFDASNLSSFNAALDTFNQLDEIRNYNDKFVKSMNDMMNSHIQSTMPPIPDWQKFAEPPKKLPVIPQTANWQANIIDPLEKQLGAMQDLSASIAEQNVALHKQSELFQQQLVESQKANELKEKELKDNEKSRKIDRRWVIASFCVAFFTLIATLIFGFYPLTLNSHQVAPLSTDKEVMVDEVKK